MNETIELMLEESRLELEDLPRRGEILSKRITYLNKLLDNK